VWWGGKPIAPARASLRNGARRLLASTESTAEHRKRGCTSHATVMPSDRYSLVTEPREVLPGRSYLLTRRCTQRQFLLKPSPLTNQLVRYCLGVAASKTGVLLHAVCFMSNHWHGVVTDPFARLPAFLEHFHRLLAKAQNASLGRWENFWSSDKSSVVLLVSDDDVLDKMAYTIANPTAAGLVRSPREWPGVVTTRIGERRVVDMPDVFFDPEGPLPAAIALELTRPPIYPHLDDLRLSRHLASAVERRVCEARDALARRGRKFLGAKGVRQQAFDAVPQTIEPRRNSNPRIAAAHTAERVRAIRNRLSFLRDYRAAWHAWRHGKRQQVFPAGTYALRIYARVACAPACPT
jgi:putative transposase